MARSKMMWVSERASQGGGTIAGRTYGVAFGFEAGGSLSIYGCPLQLSGGGQLTGKLKDGTPIDTLTLHVTTSNLIRTCPDTIAPTTTASATAGPNPNHAPSVAS